MKERLDQLTLQNLIDLSCGDYSVLNDRDEIADEHEVIRRTSRILAEYKSIASPVQAKMDLSDGEKLSKLRIKERCARIAQALNLSGHPDKAREILVELGIDAERLQTVEAIESRCQAILGEVEYERKRIEEYKAKRRSGNHQPEQVRRSWYAEIAGVMSTLKVPIDMGINAAIYANLVHQAVERNKALAKMPPSSRMFM